MPLFASRVIPMLSWQYPGEFSCLERCCVASLELMCSLRWWIHVPKYSTPVSSVPVPALSTSDAWTWLLESLLLAPPSSAHSGKSPALAVPLFWALRVETSIILKEKEKLLLYFASIDCSCTFVLCLYLCTSVGKRNMQRKQWEMILDLHLQQDLPLGN